MFRFGALTVTQHSTPASGRGTAFGFVSSGLLAAQGLGFLTGGAAAESFGPQQVVAGAGASGQHGPLRFRCRRVG
jgi:hypothetical protein